MHKDDEQPFFPFFSRGKRGNGGRGSRNWKHFFPFPFFPPCGYIEGSSCFTLNLHFNGMYVFFPPFLPQFFSFPSYFFSINIVWELRRCQSGRFYLHFSPFFLFFSFCLPPLPWAVEACDIDRKNLRSDTRSWAPPFFPSLLCPPYVKKDNEIPFFATFSPPSRGVWKGRKEPSLFSLLPPHSSCCSSR